MISIKIVNSSNNNTPSLATKGAAGADIRAFIENKIILRLFEFYVRDCNFSNVV